MGIISNIVQYFSSSKEESELLERGEIRVAPKEVTGRVFARVAPPLSDIMNVEPELKAKTDGVMSELRDKIFESALPQSGINAVAKPEIKLEIRVTRANGDVEIYHA